MEPGEITDLEELNAFLDRVQGFHDGIIKEFHLVNHNSVDFDLCMSQDQGATARLLVQRQWENPSAVELILYNIHRIHVHTEGMVFDTEGFEEEGRLRLSLDGSDFVFGRMTYRDASAWMGAETRFAPAIEGAPPPPPGTPRPFRSDETNESPSTFRIGLVLFSAFAVVAGVVTALIWLVILLIRAVQN